MRQQSGHSAGWSHGGSYFSRSLLHPRSHRGALTAYLATIAIFYAVFAAVIAISQAKSPRAGLVTFRQTFVRRCQWWQIALLGRSMMSNGTASALTGFGFNPNGARGGSLALRSRAFKALAYP